MVSVMTREPNRICSRASLFFFLKKSPSATFPTIAVLHLGQIVSSVPTSGMRMVCRRSKLYVPFWGRWWRWTGYGCSDCKGIFFGGGLYIFVRGPERTSAPVNSETRRRTTTSECSKLHATSLCFATGNIFLGIASSSFSDPAPPWRWWADYGTQDVGQWCRVGEEVFGQKLRPTSTYSILFDNI